MLSRKKPVHKMAEHETVLPSTYSLREFADPVPKYTMPDGSIPAKAAYQLIHDELNLDGNPALNLATFVTTWMEPEAEKLITECLNKNLVDQDEYPQTQVIHDRCVNMIAHLFNASHEHEAVGTAGIGSSEAIMLAGMAMKWRWRDRRRAEGKPTDKPNLVMGINVQVVWEKFARYWDVEPRYIPMAPGRTIISAEEVAKYVDDNTIGVVAILGSTFTGEFEPVKEINDTLMKINQENDWDIPIHVDAASGGFVAPFLYPDLHWDFRVPLVKSINVSGHKYGLVYPGVGWVVWRDKADLPEDLIFHVNYLGGDLPTFNLNFSRGAAMVIAQYYNLVRLGREGYAGIMQNLKKVSDYLADQITEHGSFEVLSDRESLPLVCWQVKADTPYTVFQLSDKLRERGWIVPAYTLPADLENVAVLRVVARESFSRDMADNLMEDIRHADKVLRETAPKAAAHHEDQKGAKPKTC